ncbi:hypothetical protein E1292_24415 [Nonomuraea deserti]|uniref:Uncharacterized protein n=1 Tax=Nonomuraea deserti TaxID=1848322 RepID=A0A4R4VIX2_9ACTN|nr:hypothetical protein [Nonomuraea deserti]TDD02055.1 hypothetical protein E1292_24415 [Nonomuraea deserti]
MWMNTVRRPADLSQELGGGHRVHADDRHQAWKAGLNQRLELLSDRVDLDAERVDEGDLRHGDAAGGDGRQRILRVVRRSRSTGFFMACSKCIHASMPVEMSEA